MSDLEPIIESLVSKFYQESLSSGDKAHNTVIAFNIQLELEKCKISVDLKELVKRVDSFENLNQKSNLISTSTSTSTILNDHFGVYNNEQLILKPETNNNNNKNNKKTGNKTLPFKGNIYIIIFIIYYYFL